MWQLPVPMLREVCLCSQVLMPQPAILRCQALGVSWYPSSWTQRPDVSAGAYPSCLQPSLSCGEEDKWLGQIYLGLGQQAGTGFVP